MYSYVQWRRQHVGSRKIFLVFATACVRDGYGRLLWQHRADGKESLEVGFFPPNALPALPYFHYIRVQDMLANQREAFF